MVQAYPNRLALASGFRPEPIWAKLLACSCRCRIRQRPPQLAASFSPRTTSTVWRVLPAAGFFCGAIGALHCPLASKGEGGTQRTLQTIEWNAYPFQIPPAKERLLLIVSAAGQPPSLKLIGKSEVAIGYWTGDAFRVVGFLRPRLSSDWRPAVTHWARLAPCLPQK